MKINLASDGLSIGVIDMNEIVAAYVPEDNVGVAQRIEQQASTLPVVGSNPTANSTSWLETQPSYWRGRAKSRMPQPGCDPLSKDYAHDMMLVGRYEDMAQQLKGKK